MYDVIVIGKGPAGLQAALYTARGNLKSLVVGRDSYLGKSAMIDNYCCTESQSGEDLLATGVKQAESFGAEFKEEMVIGIEKSDVFKVITDHASYQTKSLIIATGQPSKKVPIENIEQLEGKGIHYCSTCDGFYYQDVKIGVIGFTDYAIQELKAMLEYTKDITLYTNAQEMTINDANKDFLEKNRIPVVTKKIKAFKGSSDLESIVFEDQSEEDMEGLFIAYGTASSVDFARKLGVMIQDNAIEVDSSQRTDIDGLFAAGDCTGGFKQISTAVGQGAQAGKSAMEYIKKFEEVI